MWEIGALNVQEDHVHLFLSTSPAIAPSLIANTLKGITVRQVFKQHQKSKNSFGTEISGRGALMLGRLGT